MLELNPILKKDSDLPMYCQLYRYIREEIKSGKISVGTRLPSIRQLSQNLMISKNTIESAYQQLVDEGYIESRPRSGLYVSELEKDFSCEKTSPQIKKEFQLQLKYDYDFDPNSVDLDNFPFSVWKKLTTECLTPERGYLFKYDDTRGEVKLRKEISAYLRHSRAVYCEEEQVVIGSTAQHLVSIICQLAGLRKFKIAIEDPGCIEMKSIFRNLGFEVVGIPIEKDGINIEMLKSSGAKIVYITPSKQFPWGIIMPIGKRLKLLKWAEEENGLIIEGDYDGEYRYHGKPIPALQGLSNSDNVIYLSTFSKYLLPSICISYMVLPERLLKLYNQDYYFYEQSVPRLNQQILQQFIERGHWESHIRKMRNIYSKKHGILMNAINQYMDDRVIVVGRDAGLHLLIEVKNGMKEQELVDSAADLGVKVYPYSTYLYNKSSCVHPRIIIGFGGLKGDAITEGIKLLSEAWLDI